MKQSNVIEKLSVELKEYGSLKAIDKPLVVGGLLLALQEVEADCFSIEELTGGSSLSDGERAMLAVILSIP